MAPCANNLTHSQFFVLTKSGELRNEYLCVGLFLNDQIKAFVARLYMCSEKIQEHLWLFTVRRQMKHIYTGKCLLNVNNPYHHKLITADTCDDTDINQEWDILIRTDQEIFLGAVKRSWSEVEIITDE